MKLVTVVQHHPARQLPPELAGFFLCPDPAPDGPPSAIRTYLHCLRTRPPSTHVLVLQDDVELCARFEERAVFAATTRPDDIIALFVPGRGLHRRFMHDAAKRGDEWCPLPTSANWVPTVALIWPEELAVDFLEFGEQHVAERLARRKSTVGDDPVVGAWARARKRTVWATVPSLVEHPDVGLSLVRRRDYKGQNAARRAALFLTD